MSLSTEKNNKVTTYTINPTEFGLPLGNLEDIKAKDANSSFLAQDPSSPNQSKLG
jgi:anthranilate phosphoribosyltransferase